MNCLNSIVAVALLGIGLLPGGVQASPVVGSEPTVPQCFPDSGKLDIATMVCVAEPGDISILDQSPAGTTGPHQ